MRWHITSRELCFSEQAPLILTIRPFADHIHIDDAVIWPQALVSRTQKLRSRDENFAWTYSAHFRNRFFILIWPILLLSIEVHAGIEFFPPV
jgi:hypothetical protein